jgi:hypothetical protein
VVRKNGGIFFLNDICAIYPGHYAKLGVLGVKKIKKKRHTLLGNPDIFQRKMRITIDHYKRALPKIITTRGKKFRDYFPQLPCNISVKGPRKSGYFPEYFHVFS